MLHFIIIIIITLFNTFTIVFLVPTSKSVAFTNERENDSQTQFETEARKISERLELGVVERNLNDIFFRPDPSKSIYSNYENNKTSEKVSLKPFFFYKFNLIVRSFYKRRF